ncbi:hypothetical protein U9M48_007470 [Paspalum notatum var. saurae]|uniref:Uncharacterized protein n=1 Tax=Paspalum notatum var. saurae TaxID=547442 RepID=A0AAQ3PWS9_PASNO
MSPVEGRGICLRGSEPGVTALQERRRRFGFGEEGLAGDHSLILEIEASKEPGLRDGLEREQARHGERERLLHAQLLRRHAVGEPPREGVQQVGQDQLHHLEPERHAGAHPAAGPERQQLHVLPLDVHAGAAAAGQEPLRPELQRSFPHRRVAADGPDVDEDARARRDVVAAAAAHGHGHVLPGLPRRQERHHRVQAHRLLHDRLQVREAWDVALRHEAVAADDALQLLRGLGKDLGVP